MCLIIYSPKGTEVPVNVLGYAAEQNGDGVGVMYEGKFEKFLGKKSLRRCKRLLDSLVASNTPYGVHFRWRTHGAISIRNTHPYVTDAGLHCVMHNGILSECTAESSDKESDTAVFVRKFMADPPDLTDSVYWDAIERQIGYGNKFLVMDVDGAFKVLNEDAGVWIEGNWFSNTYSLPASFAPSRYTGYNSYNWKDYDDDGYQVGRSSYGGARTLYAWHEPSKRSMDTSKVYETENGDETIAYNQTKHCWEYSPIKRLTYTKADGTVIDLNGMKPLQEATNPQSVYYQEDEEAKLGLLPDKHYVEQDSERSGEIAAIQRRIDRARKAWSMKEGEQILVESIAEIEAIEVEVDLSAVDGPADDDTEEQTRWREYLAAVGAGLIEEG